MFELIFFSQVKRENNNILIGTIEFGPDQRDINVLVPEALGCVVPNFQFLFHRFKHSSFLIVAKKGDAIITINQNVSNSQQELNNILVQSLMDKTLSDMIYAIKSPSEPECASYHEYESNKELHDKATKIIRQMIHCDPLGTLACT